MSEPDIFATNNPLSICLPVKVSTIAIFGGLGYPFPPSTTETDVNSLESLKITFVEEFMDGEIVLSALYS